MTVAGQQKLQSPGGAAAPQKDQRGWLFDPACTSNWSAREEIAQTCVLTPRRVPRGITPHFHLSKPGVAFCTARDALESTNLSPPHCCPARAPPKPLARNHPARVKRGEREELPCASSSLTDPPQGCSRRGVQALGEPQDESRRWRRLSWRPMTVVIPCE